MRLLSATDLAIAVALKAGTLLIQERASRFVGETYIAISDDVGIIEVQLTREEADERVAAILEAVR